MGSLGSWYSLLFLILLVSIQGSVSVKGSDLNKFYPHAPPVKTIQNQYGDVIDCVKTTIQPAFTHPSLRGHKIQMKPSFFPVDMLKDVPSDSNVEAISKLSPAGNQTCPKGTVPILRGPQDPNIVRKSPPVSGIMKYCKKSHQFAAMKLSGSKYYGSAGVLSVWNPRVDHPDQGFSQAQLWVAGTDPRGAVETIEAGWHVYPKLYSGDIRTRLFIYWTTDGYNKTGCYNLNCPGFFQVSPNMKPGDVLPVSMYNGTQSYKGFLVHKDPKTGNWWLRVDNEPIGYWPKTIFRTLASGATFLAWGGEIINSGVGGHASTEMGSGHFPREGGYGVSASFTSVYYVDETHSRRKPDGVSSIVTTRRECYDIKSAGVPKGDRGYTFFFGGPGRSDRCT